jgi:hypothetical protein
MFYGLSAHPLLNLQGENVEHNAINYRHIAVLLARFYTDQTHSKCILRAKPVTQ